MHMLAARDVVRIARIITATSYACCDASEMRSVTSARVLRLALTRAFGSGRTRDVNQPVTLDRWNATMSASYTWPFAGSRTTL